MGYIIEPVSQGGYRGLLPGVGLAMQVQYQEEGLSWDKGDRGEGLRPGSVLCKLGALNIFLSFSLSFFPQENLRLKYDPLQSLSPAILNCPSHGGYTFCLGI